MIRTTNPFNQILRESRAVFDFPGPFQAAPKLASIRQEIERRGGGIHFYSDGATERCRFFLSHGEIDAFGALLLIRELLAPRAVVSARQAGKHFGKFDEFDYVQVWAPSPGIMPNDRTFTQNIIERVLEMAPPPGARDSIAIVVAIDDLQALTSETIWGNSSAIVTFPSRAMFDLTQLSKDSWRQTLKERGQRTIRALGRRPGASDPSAWLAFSSLGALERFSWVPPLCPSELFMFPTPIAERSANILLWSYSGVQGMSIAARPGHWALTASDQVIQAWGSLLCAP